MGDPYECLALPRSAGPDDIKKSFRQLAKKLHPDANSDDPSAAELFAQLQAAYAILGDRKKRSAFDRGKIDAQGKPTRQAASHATRRYRFTSGLWQVVTCLVVAVLMPVATLPLIVRSLTPQAQINPKAGGKSGRHSDIGLAEQPERGVQSEPHLILQEIAPRAARDTVPLGAQVIGGAVSFARKSAAYRRE
jgi:curved DNA-binding protein CbpA